VVSLFQAGLINPRRVHSSAPNIDWVKMWLAGSTVWPTPGGTVSSTHRPLAIGISAVLSQCVRVHGCVRVCMHGDPFLTCTCVSLYNGKCT